ncbi:MAG: hypothetical protein U1F53_08790 [Burkholderiaceae bacterium]
MFKASVIALSLLAPLGLAPTVAQAAVDVDFVVRIPPPVPRVEVVPPPRVGYVWTPGYWGWRENHHVWVAGTWVRERPGYVYERPTWVERGGQWHLAGGGWYRHDRDRDGVPNRYDRDRDNDGVPNWADRHPNGGR